MKTFLKVTAISLALLGGVSAASAGEFVPGNYDHQLEQGR